MQTDKQKWVEEVLNSANGLLRAEAPDMTDAVISRIGSAGLHSIAPASDYSLIWKIAASVVFLLLLNGVTIYRYHNHMSRSDQYQQVQAAASELGISSGSSDPGGTIFGN